MLAQERQLLNANDKLTDLAARVRDAGDSEEPVHRVERDIWDTVMAIGYDVLNAFVQGQGDGDLGDEIELENGRTLRRMDERKSIRYVSIFGEIRTEGWAYAERESQKLEVEPTRSRLQLPESDFSIILEDWSQGLCTEMAYEKAGATLQRMLGLRLGVRAQEQMNRRMSAEVDAMWEVPVVPEAEEEEEILVIAADCGGVPLTRKEAARVGVESRDDSPRAARCKQAAVGAVYSIARFKRTPDQVLQEAQRESAAASRPNPVHKQVRAYMPTIEESGAQAQSAKDRLFGWLAAEAGLRMHAAETMVALMDGERALWNQLAEHFPPEGVHIVQILDIWHLLGYVRDAAKAFHPTDPEGEERGELETHLLTMILSGRAAWAIGSLKQMRTKRDLRGKRREAVGKTITYMENNLARMRYDEYLAAGYPIGSGAAEGTVRNLIKDRLDRTGMRWTVDGAQAMLNVRATHLNEESVRLFEHRAANVEQSHHPQRELIREVQRRRSA